MLRLLRPGILASLVVLAAFPASALGAVSADVSGSALTVFGDGGDNVITVSRVVAGKYRVEAEQAVTENSAECTVIGDDVECDVGPNPTLSMVGDAGDDLLTGAEGTVDTLYGPVGDDTLDGGLGVNALLGGEDADTFLGTSSANDTIFYASEGFTRTDGIDVTVNNGEADDGSAEDANVDGDKDEVGPGIEFVKATQHADFLTGDAGPNKLDGAGGDDQIAGGGGVDELIGGGDSDTVAAVDGGPDTIRCHTSDPGAVEGTADVVFADVADSADAFCETVQRPATGGGGSGGGGSGGGGTAPLIACNAFFGCFTGSDSNSVKAFPDLRGLAYDEAISLLAKSKIDAVPVKPKDPIAEVIRPKSKLPKHPKGRPYSEGDVFGQTPNPGTPVLVSPGRPVKMALSVWRGARKETCVKEGAEYTGTDFATFERIMLDLGCKIDDLRLKVKKGNTKKPGEADIMSGDRCEAVRPRRASGKRLDATLEIPASPALQDLRLGFRESTQSPSFIASDNDREAWSLPVTEAQKAGMVVSAQDRSGALLDGVDIYVDATDAGGGLVDAGKTALVGGSKASRGSRSVAFDLDRMGTVRVVGVGTDRNGNSICGAAVIRVTNPGNDYVTVSGNGWKEKGDKFVRNAVPATAGQANVGAFFRGVGDFFARLFSPISPTMSGNVLATAKSGQPPRDKVRETYSTHDASQVQVANGDPLSGGAVTAVVAPKVAGLITISAGGIAGAGNGTVVDGQGRNVILARDRQGNLIGADGGTFVRLADGRLVGPDGASLIGADGGTLIGPDGATLAPEVKHMARAQLIGFDGATLVGPDGASLVGPDGASISGAMGGAMFSAASPLIAGGGAGLISDKGAG